MMDRALREPEMEGVSPLPARALQQAGAMLDQPEPEMAAPPGFAMMPVRDMGPLVPGLELEALPSHEAALADVEEAPPSLVGSPKVMKTYSFAREQPEAPVFSLDDVPILPTENVLVESHPFPQGGEARARVQTELGAYRAARGLQPAEAVLPVRMADQYRDFDVAMDSIHVPGPASVPPSVASRPPSSAGPELMAEEDPDEEVEMTPEERAAFRLKMIPVAKLLVA